jgi:hypothetical protein
MQRVVYIRDELVLKAHPEVDGPHIPLRREGKPDLVRTQLNEVRYLVDAMVDVAAQIAGHVVGDDE